MKQALYLPLDEFTGSKAPNLDLAADYLELTAVFSENNQSLSQDIVNVSELGAESEFDDVDKEIRIREDIAAGAVARMQSRKEVLTTSYPFDLDALGSVISFTPKESNLGHTAYLLSLILSNLCAVTPLLVGSCMHPTKQEVRKLRQHFQYFATAAIAGEIGGTAWSFGFPRPDGTGFKSKLTEIWDILKDGIVGADPSAPSNPKDDQIDIFAWREQRDNLPGYLLVAAQVATGAKWKSKSIKSHVNDAFVKRWFKQPPVTTILAYHVIPFARPDDIFRDDVLVVGNLLHRLRVPRRVEEAVALFQNGVVFDAFDELKAAADWIRSYVERAKSTSNCCLQDCC